MISNLIYLVIFLNGILIYFAADLILFVALCVLESVLIVFVLIRLVNKKKFIRLTSLTYNKMDVYYKKHLNNAMCASCKLLFNYFILFFFEFKKIKKIRMRGFF